MAVVSETAEVVAPSNLEGGYHLEVDVNGAMRTVIVVRVISARVVIRNWREQARISLIAIQILFVCRQWSWNPAILTPFAIYVHSKAPRRCGCGTNLRW